MKRFIMACFLIIGSCSALTGAENHQKQNDSLNLQEKHHCHPHCTSTSIPCKNDCGCNQFLFKADTSKCKIAEDDLSAFALGADFVTAFGGNDFSCSPIDGHCGIEIRPENGSSFQKSVPPAGQDGPVVSGLFDHVKFLAYSLFREAPEEDCDLCTTWIASGKQLQVENQPFNGAVSNPNADPRLAAFCFVGLDPNTLTTFDWICTNEVIYAFVERLPGGEMAFGEYAAYTYMIPVGCRTQKDDLFDDVHTFKTCYNRQKGTVTWELDGRKVFQITQIGHRLTSDNAYVFHKGKKKPLINPTRFQVLDHGGQDQDITPTGLQTGLALFTLLDFYPAQTSLKVTENDILTSGRYRGLVRLESELYRFGTTFFYNNPLLGGAQNFFVDSTLVGTTYQSTIPTSYRLFGQGAALRLFDYTISLEKH